MDGETCCGVDLDKLAAHMKVLAEPNRLRIIRLLMEGVQCNCVLGDKLDMPPNLISHHLHILLESGLVRAERAPGDARWFYYSINPEAFADWIRMCQFFFDPSRIQPRQAGCGPADANGSAAEKPCCPAT
jgi:ArsR family transcriptional regulator, arsenate/arsenite/antimonite-responsive transcriptional repressor